MKKLLLIMPFFMGYENILLKELQKNYIVTLVNGDACVKDMRIAYSGSKLRRGIHKLGNFARCADQEMLCKQMEKAVESDLFANSYDVVLAINGHGFQNKWYKGLKKSNPNARFIIYLWDDAKNLFKTSHFSIFDEKYSFNVEDCKAYGMNYLPMFVQKDEVEPRNRIYDLTIIGSAHDNRLELAKRLYEKYCEKYRMFIYLVQSPVTDDFFCHEKSMSYDEYMNILSESKVVLDIPFIYQNGPTTRFMDAKVTKTKVLTTNSDINKYDLFDSNVCILNVDDLSIDEDFIESEYNPSDMNIMTVERWVNKIGL